MSKKIVAILPADRASLGQLTVVDNLTGVVQFGPIPCCGTASRGAAKDADNETRAPRRRMGHTPTGGFDVTGTLGPDASGPKRVSYGPYARLKVRGVSGDAMARQGAIDTGNPGMDLRIHGGRQENMGKPGQIDGLVQTNGCIRVFDADMQGLLNYLAGTSFPFPMEVREGLGGPLSGVIDDASYMDPEGAG